MAEVYDAVISLPRGKACGFDEIYNEHIAEASVLIPYWTALFNECLRRGEIPRDWQDCLTIVIPKGKGCPTDPKSWRAISKKSCVYKLLSKLLCQRLTDYLEGRSAIPDEQHGFRANRSTDSACKILLDEIEKTLARPRQPLYALFVDFRAAFDTGSRTLVLQKMASLGVPTNILGLLTAILQKNMIFIDDGVTVREPIVQTTGFAQGDNLSPLLFSILINDLPSTITARHPAMRVLCFADDVVIFGRSRFHLQQATATLSGYANRVGLVINESKTEAMKFRRGGKLARTDGIRLNNCEVKYVSHFTYLGITFTTTGSSFAKHVRDRVRKALLASASIEDPYKLSVDTALKLFSLKLAPTAAFGIRVVWERLTCRDLRELDRAKPAFLKRVLGVHGGTKNRLVYLLVEANTFIEDLVQTYGLRHTPAYDEFLRAHREKIDEVDPAFFETPAMKDTAWREPNRANRHIIVKFSLHGYHHAVCVMEHYHEPEETCTCRFCGKLCGRYHAADCTSFRSLKQLNRATQR